jgi:hypothetical protein
MVTSLFPENQIALLMRPLESVTDSEVFPDISSVNDIMSTMPINCS